MPSIAPPHFWFPTRKQMGNTFESIVQGHADARTLNKLKNAPSGAATAPSWKNVGIKGMKGTEDIFDIGNRLYLKNTDGAKVTWYSAGPAPLF